MPEISIIMGVYNAEHRIEKSLSSILNQTFNDWELIICNDGSTDNTLSVLKKISKNDKRIKVLDNLENKGLAFSLNECIKKSNGDYIARMDDDDIALPTRLIKQYDFLKRNSKYSIVGSSRKLFDEKGIWGTDIRNGEVNKMDVFKGNPFIHPTVLMKKEAIISVGCYTISKITKRTEDIDLWIKMYEKGYIGYNLR